MTRRLFVSHQPTVVASKSAAEEAQGKEFWVDLRNIGHQEGYLCIDIRSSDQDVFHMRVNLSDLMVSCCSGNDPVWSPFVPFLIDDFDLRRVAVWCETLLRTAAKSSNPMELLEVNLKLAAKEVCGSDVEGFMYRLYPSKLEGEKQPEPITEEVDQPAAETQEEDPFWVDPDEIGAVGRSEISLIIRHGREEALFMKIVVRTKGVLARLPGDQNSWVELPAVRGMVNDRLRGIMDRYESLLACACLQADPVDFLRGQTLRADETGDYFGLSAADPSNQAGAETQRDKIWVSPGRIVKDETDGCIRLLINYGEKGLILEVNLSDKCVRAFSIECLYSWVSYEVAYAPMGGRMQAEMDKWKGLMLQACDQADPVDWLRSKAEEIQAKELLDQPPKKPESGQADQPTDTEEPTPEEPKIEKMVLGPTSVQLLFTDGTSFLVCPKGQFRADKGVNWEPSSLADITSPEWLIGVRRVVENMLCCSGGDSWKMIMGLPCFDQSDINEIQRSCGLPRLLSIWISSRGGFVVNLSENAYDQGIMIMSRPPTNKEILFEIRNSQTVYPLKGVEVAIMIARCIISYLREHQISDLFLGWQPLKEETVTVLTKE